MLGCYVVCYVVCYVGVQHFKLIWAPKLYALHKMHQHASQGVHCSVQHILWYAQHRCLHEDGVEIAVYT